MSRDTSVRPNLLCIVPPYVAPVPPLGAASLLGYLKAHGCYDFDFLDLRHYSSHAYAPTYRPSGVFGETYVIDVPDLPLVLRLLQAFDEGRPFVVESDPIFENYCLQRGINPLYLKRYLERLDTFLNDFFSQIAAIDFVGFTTWSSNMLTTLMAAAHLKRRKQPPFIVFGGPQVTESRNSAKLALASGLADAIALGEGEETLLSLYESFKSPHGVSGAPGTLLRDSTGAFVATERKLMRLATKPLPDFSQMPILDYQGHGLPLTLLPFEISRGCTDKCTFCSEWVFWRQFRSDTVDHVISDIQALTRKYPIQGIWFADSLLNGVKSRLIGLAEAMLSNDINLKWGGFMRADMDKETAKLLTRAGCELAFLGVESLSDETLDLMNKRRTSAQNLEAISALLEAGISRVVAGVIPGFPGDTRRRFMMTALQLRDIQTRFPARFRVNVEPFVVSPGQPLYANMDKAGLIPYKWAEEIVDIAPRYRNITDEIFCWVSGANQGIDRLGELRVATTINSVDTAVTGDPFLYATSEDITDGRFAVLPLGKDFSLGSFKSDRGLRCGLLITDDERRQAEAHSGASGLLPQNQETFQQQVEQIAARHVVAPSREQPMVQRRSTLAATDLRVLPDDAWICLSPFTVCREFPGEISGKGLLVNIVNPGLNVTVPAAAISFIASLSKRPAPWSTVRDAATTALGDENAYPTLQLLSARGFLERVDHVGATLHTKDAVC